MIKRAYHNPKGEPCTTCGLPGKKHRVAHQPQGDPCEICGLDWPNHYRKTEAQSRYFVGIDGEGQGRESHKYTLLAYSDTSGKRYGYVAPLEGNAALSTEQCLDFILAIPNHAKIFAFAFGYDLTKILTDVDDKTLYLLFRPELRRRPPGMEKYGPRPVPWNGYQLNKVSSKFIVSKGKRRRVIWDVFAFFQCKFTAAIEDWKVGVKDRVENMRRMKDLRAEFDKLTQAEILDYCVDECAYMAQLAEKLTDAHQDAGLKLRSYYGAGSSASAMLKKMGIDKAERSVPAEMMDAVTKAFFGGRFENSRIGEIPGPVYGYDISSAYPYQLTFLPCLQCGEWRHSKRLEDLKRSLPSLVRYSLHQVDSDSWGPLPFRLLDGSIVFPAQSGGGWIWSDEFFAALELFPNSVRFHEAWVYHNDCQHKPFQDIPPYYVQRLNIGKEGPGIVLKLAMNSVYGKMAQSIGHNPPYQSWAWAGMVTSGCRAQLLRAMAAHKRLESVVMLATDGIYSTEEIRLPLPANTGTNTDHRKPLGGWESKRVDKGMFAARPGIYFPLNPTRDEVKAVRARGVGRGVMYEACDRVVEAWRSGQTEVKIANVTRFYGAKSTISRGGIPGSYRYKRSEEYGQWRTRPIELSFNPLPKRQSIQKDGSLTLRKFPMNLESAAYSKSVVSVEAMLLRASVQEALEQPDGDDFADYEIT